MNIGGQTAVDCKIIEKNLIDIIEKRVAERTLKNIQIHLNSCPKCTLLVERFSQIWKGFDQTKRIEPFVSFWPVLHQKIKAYEEHKFHSGEIFFGLKRWLRPAVVTLILLIGCFFGYQMGNVSQYYGQVQSLDETGEVALEELFTAQYLSSFEDFPMGSISDFYMSYEIKQKE